MHVLHHTRHPTPQPGWIADLDELLSRSDVVSVHVPLSSDTRHLIDRRRIALLKPSSVLVNTSRGAVVDELALADALRSGHLFAAGLDVYEDEPNVLPQLLDAPRTVLLPHVVSATLKTRARCCVKRRARSRSSSRTVERRPAEVTYRAPFRLMGGVDPRVQPLAPEAKARREGAA
jgi:lactate dehydrogenase-like 2-hydroxyacid dehydrogenase